MEEKIEKRIRIRRRIRPESAPEIGEQVLASNETSTRAERFRLLKCSSCGESQLKRLHRNFSQRWLSWFLSVFPYRCRQCAEVQARLIPSFKMVMPALVIVGLVTTYVMTVRSYHGAMQARREAAKAPRKERLAQTAARMISMGKVEGISTVSFAERNQILRNQDIVYLMHTLRDRRALFQRIILSRAAYDLSATGIAGLQKAGVDEELLSLMNLRMAQVTATGGGWLK